MIDCMVAIAWIASGVDLMIADMPACLPWSGRRAAGSNEKVSGGMKYIQGQ
ncbi:MAG: hypothetical protein R2755_06780 [Acidimicrobiales bacterium]